MYSFGAGIFHISWTLSIFTHKYMYIDTDISLLYRYIFVYIDIDRYAYVCAYIIMCLNPVSFQVFTPVFSVFVCLKFYIVFFFWFFCCFFFFKCFPFSGKRITNCLKSVFVRIKQTISGFYRDYFVKMNGYFFLFLSLSLFFFPFGLF